MNRRAGRLAAAAGLCLIAGPAAALDWDRLWWNEDQIAAARMHSGDHEAAARIFENPRWRAAAWYRSGEYERAAEALKGLDDIESHYNRGNALARSGNLEGAIAAYETVLERDPGHADARHNLKVIEDLVKGQSSSSDPSQEEKEQQSGKNRDDGASGSRGDQERQQQSSAGNESSSNEDGSRSTDRSGSETRSGESMRPDGGREEQAGARQSIPEQAAGAPDDASEAEKAERRASMEQWLRRVPDDPGGLLRRKFRYQYSRRGRDDPPGAESW